MKKVTLLLFAIIVLAFTAKSQTMLTIRQVNDYNVNDEFQTRVTTNYPNVSRFKVLEKHFSANNDTVFYILFKSGYTSTLVNNPTPHLVYTFETPANDTVFTTNLDTLVNAQYQNLPNDSCDWSTDTVYYTPNYGGAMVYEHNSCTACCFEGQSYQQICGKGLGFISYDYQYAAYAVHYHSELIYYKKDTVVWGIADTTTASINENVYSKKIIISPNPFSTSTQISFDKPYSTISLALYDIQGKLLLQHNYTDCNQIILHRNQLSNGLYFVKLTLDDTWIETRKIVVGE